MATRIWLGTVSNNAATAGNWSDATVPIAGDNIVFDGRAANPCVVGANFNLDFADVKAYEDYPYDLGTALVPFTGGADIFLWMGRGKCYAKASGAAMEKVIIDTPSTALVYLTGTTQMKQIDWMRGTGEIAVSTNIDRLFIGYKESPEFDARVTISATNDIDFVHQFAGEAFIHASITGPYILGGGVIRFDDITADRTLTLVHQDAGTTLFEARNGSYGSIIGTHYLMGGQLIIDGPQDSTAVISGVLYQAPGTEIINEHLINIASHVKIGVE